MNEKAVKILLISIHTALTEILDMDAPAKAGVEITKTEAGTHVIIDPPTPLPPITEKEILEPPPPVEPPAPADPDAVLDSEGLPWDKRIHGSGKTFLKKTGAWKLIRGVDPVLVAKVKTELAQAQGVKPDPPPPLIPPPPKEEGLTWGQLMMKISDNQLDSEVVRAACNKFNVENIGLLQDIPVLVPLVATELGLD